MRMEKGRGILRRRWLLLALGLLWLLLFFTLAWPGFRASRENDEAITDLEERVGRLGEWVEIGPRGRGAVELWQVQLADRYDTLFPRDRGLQQLFYDLTRLANENGIDPLLVSVVQERRRPPARQTAALDPEAAALMNRLGIRPREMPGAGVTPHGLKLSFESSYVEMASFMDALSTLPRALTVRTVDVAQGRGGVLVDMELEYYVQS